MTTVVLPDPQATGCGQSWDGFRYFLAVARSGSISAAAKALNESQPTVGRKVRDLERTLGTQLLERRSGGVCLTPSGEKIVANVERIEREAKSIRDTILGLDERLEGKVVVTAPEGFGVAAVVPRMRAFAGQFPGIDVELILGTSKVNLPNRDADIAIRIGDPVHPSLVGRKAGAATFSLYASHGYLARRPAPERPEDLDGHDIIDGARDLEHVVQSQRLKSIAPAARRVFQTDSALAQLGAALDGLGVAALPRYLAAGRLELVELLPGEFAVSDHLWVLTHSDLKDVARIRAASDFLVKLAKEALAV